MLQLCPPPQIKICAVGLHNIYYEDWELHDPLGFWHGWAHPVFHDIGGPKATRSWPLDLRNLDKLRHWSRPKKHVVGTHWGTPLILLDHLVRSARHLSC